MCKDKLTISDYNSEPVHYCKRCLSLLVTRLSEDTDYCEKCGSTDIVVSKIEDWLELTKKENK